MENQDAMRDQATDQGISLDELEDVEAHGLKEIAAAAGAAAVITGGIASMAIESGSAHAANVPSVQSITQQDSAATLGASSVGNAAVSDAASALDASVARVTADTSQIARNTAPAAAPAVSAVGGAASHTVHVAASVAGTNADASADTRAVNNTVDLTDATSNSAGATVDRASNAVNQTVSAVKAAVNATTAKVNAAVKGAVTSVKNTQATAIHVVSGVRLVDGGWSIGVQVLGTDVQANALSPTGLVTITDSHGNVVGSTTMSHAAGTIKIANAGSGAVFTIHYPGDSAHAGSVLQWVAPSS